MFALRGWQVGNRPPLFANDLLRYLLQHVLALRDATLPIVGHKP